MNLVQSFGDKIVVDRESQFVIFRVVNLVLPKRHISNGKVKEIVWKIHFFVTCDMDICIGVQQLRDATTDVVKLYAVQSGCGQPLRQESKEVANTHCRLQDAAKLESHITDSLIDCLDDHGAGIM